MGSGHAVATEIKIVLENMHLCTDLELSVLKSCKIVEVRDVKIYKQVQARVQQLIMIIFDIFF